MLNQHWKWIQTQTPSHILKSQTQIPQWRSSERFTSTSQTQVPQIWTDKLKLQNLWILIQLFNNQIILFKWSKPPYQTLKMILQLTCSLHIWLITSLIISTSNIKQSNVIKFLGLLNKKIMDLLPWVIYFLVSQLLWFHK